MGIKKVSKKGKKIRLTIEMDLDSNSMLQSEENIEKILNEAGIKLSELALKEFDTDGSKIEVDGKILTSKGVQKKNYQGVYGMIKVSRYVYQGNEGGKIYVPLEKDGRIVQGATPKFAKSLSSKYSQMSTTEVQKDLLDNHGRKISQDYIQKVSNKIGTIIEQSESEWDYTLNKAVLEKTATVSIGRDGTTTYIRNEGYRETMSGTISFYDKDGDRLQTIYKAQAPEYGKSTFNSRFSEQIKFVQSELQASKQEIVYVGLADGAKDNWTFLEEYTEISILDYWHACEYLTLACKMVSKSIYQQKEWLIEARKTLKSEKNGAIELLKEMKTFIKKRGYSKTAKEGLNKAITYFDNHYTQMEYADCQNKNLPIGSGVTEAACKVIVKQRLSNSGMKWNIKTAQNVLNIRTLRYSDNQWSQFWTNFDFNGFSPN